MSIFKEKPRLLTTYREDFIFIGLFVLITTVIYYAIELIWP